MSDIEDPAVEGLDLEAWKRWVAYRVAIRKPIKPFSARAMAVKLSKYGAEQSAVIDQSIAQQWTGLFDLKDKPKPRPGERREKTEAERDKERAQLSAEDEKSAKGWSEASRTALGKLLLADALLARYLVNPDSATLVDRIEHLREQTGQLIRECDPREVVGDPRLSSMVLYLFGDRGLNRLRNRAKEAASHG